MRNVYIVGPSCGGKTSLLHYLKEKAADRFNIPIRVVSRPPRKTNDELENTFLSQEEFVRTRGNHDSEFFLSWHKLMEGTRKEYYGFRRKDMSDTKINILSCNNALLLYPESHIPKDATKIHESYFVACIAPDEIRKNRLHERSPEYSNEEVNVRIYQESIDDHLLELNLIIDTSKGDIHENGQKVLGFLTNLSGA